MSIEIKTASIEPVRATFANISRRFGEKAATRYQEATYDIQPEGNEHYRPLWDHDHEMVDASRTQIVMRDWYDLKDPRQYYYGAYVQQRAKMQEIAEGNYSFFDKRNLAELLTDDIKSRVIKYLVPLRHVEHTANLNNMFGCAYGFGTTLTQAFLYNGMDRLGMAQYLSRIGLLLDGNTGSALAEAKQAWMEDPMWQGLRALCESTLVVKDWFELFIAQNVVMDGLAAELFYRQFDQQLVAQGGQDIGMLTEFMREWEKDSNRWVDAVVKVTLAESDGNAQLLRSWTELWRSKVAEAYQPIADSILGSEGLNLCLAELDKRLTKLGLC
ncbi:aromatic/alkene monooxygenase hydroxylase subunit beta [Halioxenophilus sp. WMMB6]|uniref:aromatic/alkene monooxygenase hydroxylase subunit beta n=1 Tax=Halioxenophilus sp. WMMB6 TaxID=3073815 RepID=UPI00295E8307|nr:aromatic/alkene monooxygenase hydroxylase subunit beta [Halioxenophilus sp. WMMB6]